MTTVAQYVREHSPSDVVRAVAEYLVELLKAEHPNTWPKLRELDDAGDWVAIDLRDGGVGHILLEKTPVWEGYKIHAHLSFGENAYHVPRCTLEVWDSEAGLRFGAVRDILQKCELGAKYYAIRAHADNRGLLLDTCRKEPE
jgi:hypothetical protein